MSRPTPTVHEQIASYFETIWDDHTITHRCRCCQAEFAYTWHSVILRVAQELRDHLRDVHPHIARALDLGPVG